MDKSFDLVTLLKNHEKKHKHKPTSIVSVSSGIQKRLENNIKRRKSSRLTKFDSIRNLPSSEIPETISESQKKIEYRRMQLEKWKEEKAKKKKEASSQKKKPFLAGIAHAPLNYVPPPPLPKQTPSTSGRVTRSQTSKMNCQIAQKNTNKSKPTKLLQSFAPSNASFKPPEFKNFKDLPTLAPLAQTKSKKINSTFEHKVTDVTKQTYSNAAKSDSPSKSSTSKVTSRRKPKGAFKHVNTKVSKASQDKMLHSSTSNSDMECLATEKQTKNKTPRKSIQAECKTPKNCVPKSESSSEERLRSSKSLSCEKQFLSSRNLSNTPMTPEQIADEAKNISPCVTLSRGKDNARKEMKKKIEEGLLDNDTTNKENVDHFRRQLESEVTRITEMCETWEKIFQQMPLSDSVQELILGAVGQARLLVSQKLTQFGSLVSACANPEPGAALVTPADLHGFWDMVFMQVENVDMRFKNLESLQARNWVEEQTVVQKKRSSKPVRNTTKPAATSRIRDLIAAARKAKKVEDTSGGIADRQANAEANSKTFEAGFFRVQSPVKSPLLPSTPNKPSLLKAVLSSEAKKASHSKISASLAMMRASIIGRNVESGDAALEHREAPVTPINLMATPARSILKSATAESSKKKSGKKSIKAVLFNDSDNEINDNEDTTQEERVQVTIADTLPSSDLGDKSGNEKENQRRRPKLCRQNVFDDGSPILTRSRRKSMNTPLLDINSENLEGRRSRVKAKDNEEDKSDKTPKRFTRRMKKSIANEVDV